ncbi:hypothetical protein RFI_13159 [Reticulomyxa filosa]|uniref:DEP domain-containing protein n=1 Tax=Reticulomyxa filosa TaxID=46433 RepID=X6NDD5_RETFI|nr:hypothetical protein RFI_13159 [Reticulomyxa filosa]|eukprot:ETO24001.1 hypothetical protein RFI_13159 [Reticulomyxa filosa]
MIDSLLQHNKQFDEVCLLTLYRVFVCMWCVCVLNNCVGVSNSIRDYIHYQHKHEVILEKLGHRCQKRNWYLNAVTFAEKRVKEHYATKQMTCRRCDCSRKKEKEKIQRSKDRQRKESIESVESMEDCNQNEYEQSEHLNNLDKELHQLCKEIHSSGIIRDQRRNGFVHSKVFLGSELITWLTKSLIVNSRYEAAVIGSLLLKSKIVYPVIPKHVTQRQTEATGTNNQQPRKPNAMLTTLATDQSNHQSLTWLDSSLNRSFNSLSLNETKASLYNTPPDSIDHGFNDSPSSSILRFENDMNGGGNSRTRSCSPAPHVANSFVPKQLHTSNKSDSYHSNSKITRLSSLGLINQVSLGLFSTPPPPSPPVIRKQRNGSGNRVLDSPNDDQTLSCDKAMIDEESLCSTPQYEHAGNSNKTPSHDNQPQQVFINIFFFFFLNNDWVRYGDVIWHNITNLKKSDDAKIGSIVRDGWLHKVGSIRVKKYWYKWDNNRRQLKEYANDEKDCTVRNEYSLDETAKITSSPVDHRLFEIYIVHPKTQTIKLRASDKRTRDVSSHTHIQTKGLCISVNKNRFYVKK